jgi:hypothetical protein
MEPMYTLRVIFPDGCAVEYAETGTDGYPVVTFLPVEEGHEHPNDPDAGDIHRAAGRAFLDAIARVRAEQVPTP